MRALVRLIAIVLSLGSVQGALAQSVAPSTAESAEQHADGAADEERAQPSSDGEDDRAGRWQTSCRVDPSTWRGSRVPDTPVYARAPDGACFCSVLTSRATRAGRRHTFGGWALGTAAAGLVAVGAVLGNAERGNVWERERGTLLTVSGLALAPLAYYFFRRADRDGTVAARATEAQGQGSMDDDFALYRACAAAKADWVASREASVAVSALAVERMERTAEQTRKQVEAAGAAAEESRANAEAANKAAEQAQQSAEQAEASAEEHRGPRRTPPPVEDEEVETKPGPARRPVR